MGLKHIFINGGECKGWSPMTPKCTSPTLGAVFMQKSRMFEALVGKANKHQIGPLIYHWKGLEMEMFKVPLHYSCKPDMHELKSKEGVGVKLGI